METLPKVCNKIVEWSTTMRYCARGIPLALFESETKWIEVMNLLAIIRSEQELHQVLSADKVCSIVTYTEGFPEHNTESEDCIDFYF